METSLEASIFVIFKRSILRYIIYPIKNLNGLNPIYLTNFFSLNIGAKRPFKKLLKILLKNPSLIWKFQKIVVNCAMKISRLKVLEIPNLIRASLANLLFLKKLGVSEKGLVLKRWSRWYSKRGI